MDIKKPLSIIKIGGNIIDNPTELTQFYLIFLGLKATRFLFTVAENQLPKWPKVLV